MAATTDADLAQRVLRGIGVSAGSVSGPAVVIGLPPQVPADEPASTDVDADWARISDALGGVAENLEKKAATIGGPAADILSATALMARDPTLGKGIRAGLAAGRGPVNAVHAAVEDVCTMFTAAGGYLAERTTDLRDVASRVIARLLGVPEPSVPELSVPSVLIAHDLAPADTAGLSPVTTLAIGRRPADARTPAHPWPTDPVLYEVSSSHEEGGERAYLASTVAFVGGDGDDAGHVRQLRLAVTEYLPDGRRVPTAGTERDVPADLVLVCLGFTGPETADLCAQLPVTLTDRGLVARDEAFATSVPGVFVAGDAGRGQSLVVWAIAEGRAAAAAVDAYLTGDTELPVPVTSTTATLRP